MRALVRLIWRLYPRRWRARFGAEAEADLGRGGGGPRLVLDALRTLPRAWASELGRRGAERRDRRSRGGGAGLGVDLRGAWRSLVRSPGHVALVVATLALALGANAAVFSVSWAVLLRTLPYEEPDRIVTMEPSPVEIRASGWGVAMELLALPDVETAGLYIPDGGANLVDEREAVRLQVTQVGPGFFPVLGIEPLAGRTIGPESPASPEAVLSHTLWVDAFGADASVVGRPLDLSGHRFTIVGVAPPDVDLPAGTDVWASMPSVSDFYATAFAPRVIARLRSPEAVGAVLAARRAQEAERWAERPPRFNRPEVVVQSLREELVGPIRAPLLALAGAAAAVLLLGCLNLAGIEVARVFRRADELGVRRALGAGAGRIFRHLALEVMLLAALSGAAALAVAWIAGRALASWLPPELPGLEHAGLAPPVLVFTALATAAAAMAVGLLPALRGARFSSPARGGRTATADRERVRLQQGLVAAQVAVAIALSAGAGLLGRSLAALRAVPLGYDESVLTFRVRLPTHAYPDVDAQHGYVERVRTGLAALPGVEAVAFSNRLPLETGLGRGVGIRAGDTPDEEGERFSAAWIEVSEGFFDAMGIRLLGGTEPTAAAVRGEDVGGVVIDRSTAVRLYGDDSPLGRPIVFQGRRDIPGVVVGVAEDIRLQGHTGPSQHAVYTSTEDAWVAAVSFAVRTRRRPSDLVGPVRAALAGIDPGVPPFEIRTTGQAAAGELAARRTLATLSGLFGVAGLVLVGLGLYGMVAQGVASRRRDLGIRLALGAAVARVVRETVGRALLPVLLGAAVGVPVALGVARLLRGLLFGVSPRDPAVLAGVVAVVLVVGALAALLPASRVGRIDPVESLRSE